MLPKNYVERVYAGFLGMNIGIRLGAPLEPNEWSYEKIQEIHGDIRGYVKDYKTFSADDDANGPVYFIRALIDDARGRELTPQDVARAWLNYSREGIGMFWWGGDQISTEHTAYLNLKKGIPAPKSGSAEVNGIIMAEQIGGQIFIDTWGLLFPDNIQKAADYAEIAASVSHDKNGLYGARFMAACISRAFSAESMDVIIEAGLSVIPKDSTYYAVVKAVIDFYQEHPEEEDFRKCRQYLENEWGYDKYTGVCHIIPNAGVCALALMYGKGDLARTVEIATMCSWDTDCNAGNVGTIAGVFAGLDAIPGHYRKPINDMIATSSVSGYLNVLDIPTFCKELAVLGYQVNGLEAPQRLVESIRNGEVYLDFTLPGSTHGFKTNNAFKTLLTPCNDLGIEGRRGSLSVLFDRFIEGDSSKIFYKPFYRREDFNDEKYKPTFAPSAYSGQKVSAKVYMDKWQGGADVYLTPYVRNSYTKSDVRLDSITLNHQQWLDIEFVIPETDGALIDEVGFIVESPSPADNRSFGKFYIGEFRIFGNADYSIDFAKQAMDFKCVTPFAHHRGEWTLENGFMKAAAGEGDTSSFTGNYYGRDLELDISFQPVSGKSHGVILRAIGTERYYWAGFDGDNQVSLIENNFGFKRLKTISYEWNHEAIYNVKAISKGTAVQIEINGERVLDFDGLGNEYGMAGFGLLEKGETTVRSFHVKEMNK
ncbi:MULTISPECIES: ADP-ribosylglycohydrolase family protein [unclassified Cytobacillus]|uniref:ADP-ribosylglycohydrolase family protein n=1 Tax=unclassified Cytobacillus TaxID=2675268 RepID=UPI00203E09B3|nr:ADP-ribosylglycohydrolase family protein [Cytobacillus sp. AMY 15.2]MCM3090686.1 ADP-ribosylglycohydrolase family protein [Cytobacillus sp. AMY 15.2]